MLFSVVGIDVDFVIVVSLVVVDKVNVAVDVEDVVVVNNVFNESKK